MAFTTIPTGLKQEKFGHPLDGRTHYDTIEEALADNFYRVTTVAIPPSNTPTEVIETNRFIGQKIMIQNPPDSDSPHEYWFRNGITNADLIKYDSYEWENLEPGTGGGGSSGGSCDCEKNQWEDVELSNFHPSIDLDQSDFICKYNPASKIILFTGKFRLKNSHDTMFTSGNQFCSFENKFVSNVYFIANNSELGMDTCVSAMKFSAFFNYVNLMDFKSYGEPINPAPEYVFSVMLPTMY